MERKQKCQSHPFGGGWWKVVDGSFLDKDRGDQRDKTARSWRNMMKTDSQVCAKSPTIKSTTGSTDIVT